jgi:hypothetical protein
MYYHNSWLCTGSKSDGDDCWNDARDLTRDNHNRFLVLDKLSGGQPKVKVFDVSSNPGVSKGGFGDSTTISGDPRRIEGSDYDSYIVVLHGVTPPQMISIFTKCEMPG